MAALSDADLTTEAGVIKNETTPAANSATRIGQMLVDLTDSKLNKQDVVEPPLIYAAKLTQSGTGNPSTVIQANTLSGAINWGRAGNGQYQGLLSGAFPTDARVHLLAAPSFSSVAAASIKNLAIRRIDTDTVEIIQSGPDGSTIVDDMICYVEIKVYPA